MRRGFKIGLLSAFCILLAVSTVYAVSGGSMPEDVIQEKHKHPKSKSNIWIYFPKEPKKEKLSCVLIAAAGSRLFHGISLSDGDVPEHVPYAQSGFVVVAYDVSGPLENVTSDEEVINAAKAFMESEGGIRDAIEALEFATSKYSIIDQSHVYAVGHSSAATLALSLIEKSDRFKCCVAYAPIGDIEARIGTGLISLLDRYLPGFKSFLLDYAPVSNVKKIKCPVYIFNAEDDNNVTPDTINSLVALLKKEGVDYTHHVEGKGGHYYSMLNEGIPRGIRWIKAMETRKSEPDTSPDS